MTIETVTVFGATGMQGRHQPRELLKHGYKVRVVSRKLERLDHPDFEGTEKLAANFDDAASVDRALVGADAIFYQVQSFVPPAVIMAQTETVRRAAANAGVQLIIVNSSMWAPDEPSGKAQSDWLLSDCVYSMEETMRAGSIPVIVFRPTLFMSNLHGPWVKNSLRNGVYRYCHKPDLLADWICLEDVAQFMVAALKKPELAGRKIMIGGPDRLRTLDMVELIGKAMGTELRFEYVPPRAFAEEFWNVAGAMLGLSHDEFVENFGGFYTMNNEDPRAPFQADVEAALELFPEVKLTSMHEWAARQDWSVA